jgi:hypothetical protein
MPDPHDYTAAINRKGCDNTGITEDLVREMYGTLGRRTLAIVELKHHGRGETDDNGRTVQLQIAQIEPSRDANLDDHLRELMRTMHQNRALHADDQQLQIDNLDDVEPTVERVIAAGQEHIAQTDQPFDEEDPDGDDGSEDADLPPDEALEDDQEPDPDHGDEERRLHAVGGPGDPFTLRDS